MLKIIKTLTAGISLFIMTQTALSLESYSGAAISAPLISQDPPHLQGVRISLWHQPKALIWEHTKIFFDGSLGTWWLNHYPQYNTINIFSLAPILRYYIINNRFISPFMDLSIGVSYLSDTHFETRNLGMHFSFQDQLGVGASFGTEKHLSMSLSALHYSNASLSGWNGGITVPLMLNLGYRF